MLKEPIFYLRRENFDNNGNIKNHFFLQKILIVFIHEESCIFCNLAKNDYQSAAIENKNDNIFFGAIQADGEVDGEQECGEIFDKIVENFRGFPEYAIFVDGKPSNIELEGRTKNIILKTLSQIEYNFNKNNKI